MYSKPDDTEVIDFCDLSFLKSGDINSTLTHMILHIIIYRASLVAQMVKKLPEMWETRVSSLGQEDPLEKGMATHSSIFAWRIPWTEEPGRL